MRKVPVRRTLVALIFVAASSPVAAQAPATAYPAGAIVQPLPPVDPLAANLKILAQNPYDVNALTQAGIGALEVGDPQAAIGFLARADELSPRDPRIKAALGTALTQVERPQEALRTYGEAVALGLLDRMIAKDRGLAYDLVGDQKRAQKDYALAEKQGADPETIRRHALSLAISGEGSDAVKMLDPLTKRGDQSAWRAKAFALALSGDMPAADQIIRAATPASALSGMMAFLRRLPSLTPAQRASAVHFGTIPTTGPIYAAAEPSESFRSIGNGQLAGLSNPEPTRPQTASAQPVKLTRSQQRDVDRRERELAKIARRGQQVAAAKVPVVIPPSLPPARPVAVELPPRPTQTAALDRRVGQRIGPVDPARLPEELRPGAANSPPVRIIAARELPRPDGVPPAATKPPVVTPTPAPQPPRVPEPRPAAVVPPSQPTSVAITPPAPTIPPPALVAPSPIEVAKKTEPVVPPSTPAFVPPPAPAPSPGVTPPPLPVEQKTVVATPAPLELPPMPVATGTKPVELASISSSAIPSATQTPVISAVSGPPVALANLPESVADASPSPGPGFVDPVVEKVPEPVQVAQAELPPATEKPADRLGALLDGITTETESAAAPLPNLAELRAQRLAAQKKADAEAKSKADKETADKAEKEAAARKAEEEAKANAAKLKANPGRIWVQIATGANRSGLPFTWRKLREEAPKALSGQTAWFSPFRATHRLLVGPMKTPGEARQLVTALSREGVAATTWSSEPGQDVSRLSGK